MSRPKISRKHGPIPQEAAAKSAPGKRTFPPRQEPYYLCQRSPGSGNANALQPVIGHSFVVLDDREYVTANPHVHGGRLGAPSSGHSRQLRLRTGIR